MLARILALDILANACAIVTRCLDAAKATITSSLSSALTTKILQRRHW